MPAPRQPIEIREFPRPDLPSGAALLRTLRSEVCGTDVHLWHGRLAGVPYPIIPGHVSAGVIEAMRGSVHGLDGSALVEGDRAVFFDVHRTCGHCRACTVHRTPTRCPSRRVYGITDSADEGLFGGWSQHIYLEPGVGIARLPDSVSVDDYIGGGCGLLTAVHIRERAALRPGDSVLVQGVGAVGLCAIALCRLAGVATIFAVGDPESRLALARRMGADHVFALASTSAEERLQAVRDRTHGEGVDVVIEAAGSARAIEEGVTLVRDGGRYVDRRSLHRRWTEHDQRAPAHQSQAPRDPRLLGKRVAALPRGDRDPRRPRRRSLARHRGPDVPARLAQPGARRCRGHADHQGAGGSVGVAKRAGARRSAFGARDLRTLNLEL